jgi:hypothetical protein
MSKERQFSSLEVMENSINVIGGIKNWCELMQKSIRTLIEIEKDPNRKEDLFKNPKQVMIDNGIPEFIANDLSLDYEGIK